VNSRNHALDVLRAAAILEIIGYHMGLPAFSATAAFGVDLFFVLSGFFISGALFSDYRKYGTIRLTRFWMRRAFKILPPIYFYLFIVLLLMVTIAPMREIMTTSDLWHVVLFCSNYYPAHRFVAHTWSLSLEEQFYLCLPLLLVALRRWNKSLTTLPWVFLLVMVVTFVFRVFDPANSWSFQSRADNLFAGVMLRYMVDFKPTWFSALTRFALVPGLLCWIPAVLLPVLHSGPAVSLMYVWIDLSCACLVAWCYAHDSAAFWSWAPFKALASVGFYSYSIYIWQQPIFCVFRYGFPSSPLMVAAGFATCLLIGIGMAKLIEAPAMHLRDAWFKETPVATLLAVPQIPQQPQAPMSNLRL